MPVHKKIAKKVSKFAKTQVRGTKIVGKAIAKTAKTLSFGAFKSRGGRLLPPGITISNVRPHFKKREKIKPREPKLFTKPTRKPRGLKNKGRSMRSAHKKRRPGVQ